MTQAEDNYRLDVEANGGNNNREEELAIDTDDESSVFTGEEIISPQMIEDQRLKMTSRNLHPPDEASSINAVIDKKKNSPVGGDPEVGVVPQAAHDEKPHQLEANVRELVPMGAVLEARPIDESEDIEAVRQNMAEDREAIVADIQKETQKLREELKEKNFLQKRPLVVAGVIVCAVLALLIALIVGLTAGDDDSFSSLISSMNEGDALLPGECPAINTTLYSRVPHCGGIAAGQDLKYQENFTIFGFTVALDVQVDDTTKLESCQFEERIQYQLVPEMAGCSRNTPPLSAFDTNVPPPPGGDFGPPPGDFGPPPGDFGSPPGANTGETKAAVGNARVVGTTLPDGQSCLQDTSQNCVRVVLDLIVMTRSEPAIPLEATIDIVFGSGSLTPKLDLEGSFGDIELVSVTPTE